jgi:hypothetical protein
MVRDRDGKFPELFDAILADAGIDVVLSGIQMPRMYSIMERWVQTCRRELLDRTSIWNHRHLLITEPHPLLADFLDAVDGRFPPADGSVTVVPALPRGLECSVAFTGHAVIATALPAADVHAHRPDGFGASLAPDFLRYLAGPTGWIGVIDATLAGRGTGGTPRLQPFPDADEHPRVGHARQLRTNVRVFGDERGLITLAHGLAGRSELSIELHRPPIAIAAHAAVLALMMLAKLGTAEPTPDLRDPGVADVALLLVILGTAVVHAVHLHRWRARLTRSLVPASGQQQDARDSAEHHGGES